MSNPNSPTGTPTPKLPARSTTATFPSPEVLASTVSPTTIVKEEMNEDIKAEVKQEMTDDVKEETKAEDAVIEVSAIEVTPASPSNVAAIAPLAHTVESIAAAPPSSSSPTPAETSRSDEVEDETDSSLTEQPNEDALDVEMTDDEARPATKKRKRAEDDDYAPEEQANAQQELVEREHLSEDDIQQRRAAKKTKTANGVSKAANFKKTPALQPRNGKSVELLKKSLKAVHAHKVTKTKPKLDPAKTKVSLGAILPPCYDNFAPRKLKEETNKIENNGIAKPIFKGASWDDEDDPKIKWKLIPKSTKYMKHKGSGINIENFLLNPYDHPDIEMKTYEEDNTFWLVRVEDITWEEHQARCKVMWEAAKQERAQKAREERTRERRERKARAATRDFEPEKNTHEASRLRKEMNGEFIEERPRVKKRKAKASKPKQAKKKEMSEEWILDE